MNANANPTTLREARESRDLTQEALAGLLGVTRAAVSQWETAETVPSGPSRMLLAQIFGVDAVAIESWFARAEVA